MSAVIEIDLAFGQPASFHCPVCGINFEDHDDRGEMKTCPHLVFAFLESEGMFVHDEVNAEEMMESAEDEEAHRALARILGDEPTKVAFRVHSGGMACGPVWTTMFYGLDMSRVAKDA